MNQPPSLPDFIIIGAMKCGTSTLAAQLSAQEGLFMTTPKEPNFFSDDAEFSRGHDWYQSLYSTAQTGDLCGEASTHYTKLPTYPETLPRLLASGATPKLIYILRDPIERLISHYIHEWTQGVMQGPIEQAVTRHPELQAYSEYGTQISPWVDAYGSDNILILNMAQLKTDPQAMLMQVGQFLQRPDLAWQNDQARVNVSSERIRKRPLDRLLIGNPVATWLRRNLVPQSLRDVVKAKRQIRNRPSLPLPMRNNLITTFRADRQKLLRMFPDRPELSGIYPDPS